MGSKHTILTKIVNKWAQNILYWQKL